MKTTLLIMAAGIGSRFGTGIKQLEPVDDAGHIIMDYSIHDAIEAGFNHVVFIIRKDIEKEFKEVIGVLTQSELYEKTISNMLECKSRGAYLMGLTTYGKYEIEDQVNFTVYVPKVDEHFVGSLAVIPLQLLGYYVSVAKGLDVDKPRNLAKSVTVE